VYLGYVTKRDWVYSTQELWNNNTRTIRGRMASRII
jgi:hypothetical protein